MIQMLRNKDFWAGLFFVAFAAGAFYFGRDLDLGTARQMGPGYFPAILAGFLLVLGLAIMLRGLKTNLETIEVGRLRPFLILIAVLLFAWSVQNLGFVIATSLMVVIGSYALPSPRLVLIAGAAAGLSFFVWLVFVVGLGVPLHAWPV